jgi:hypothetical protein
MRAEDKLRQAREEYEGREVDAAKRRAAEAKRQQGHQVEEIKNLAEEYDQRLNEVKEHNRQVMSEKDLSNNQKIDEVRQVFRDSLRNKMEESTRQKEVQKATFDGELGKQKDISKIQRENQASHFKDELKSYDERFAKDISENRKQSKEDVHANVRKLNSSHTKERNALVASHEEALLSQKHNASEMRKSYEGLIKDSQRKQEGEKSRWSQKLRDTITNDAESYAEDLSVKQELLDSERKVIRNKFDKVLNKKTQEMDEVGQQFRDSVTGRMNSQIGSRDAKIQSLTNHLKNEMAKGERLRGVERKEIINDYEKRIALMKDQQEDVMVHLKDVNQGRVEKVTEKSEAVLHRNDRTHKSQVQQEKTSRRQERELTGQQHKDQIEQVSNSAESRVKKILDLSHKTGRNLEKYYSESMEQMSDNYNEHVDRQIEKSVMDRVALNKVMTEKFRSIEGSFNTKLENTKSSYEDAIAKLKENQQKEIKSVESKYNQRFEEKGKLSKLEKETMEIRYESKLAQLNESHQDQLDRMNRRHQEDMQNLTAKMSTYSRKA